MIERTMIAWELLDETTGLLDDQPTDADRRALWAMLERCGLHSVLDVIADYYGEEAPLPRTEIDAI